MRRWMFCLAVLFAATATAQAQISINEIRIDQSSTDNDEFFELAGPPGASLAGLSYIVIGDGTGGSGVIEHVLDLSAQAIGASGYFVVAEGTFTLGIADLTATLDFENSDNVTHLLVQDFTGASGDDLDTNDDGMLDTTPWTLIVDCVALIESVGTGDLVYCTTQVGPDGSFVPAQVYRCPNGTGAWEIGLFQPLGATDTPGADNPCTGLCVPPAFLNCDSDCTTDTVTLSWDLPVQSTFNAITITRDGTLLATLSGTDITYDDTTVVAGATYTYEVTGDCGTSTATATCVVNHCPCLPPVGLACQSDCGTNDVNLAWTNGDTYSSIDVFRDGGLIASLPGAATSYTDPALASGNYGYEVVGTCASGPASAACNIIHCLPLPQITINEIRHDQPGADDDEEFAELVGPPGTPLDGLTYIVIGDGAAGDGEIEEVVDLTGFALDANGFFVFAQSDLDPLTDPALATACVTYQGVGVGPDLIIPDLNFENSDNVTHLLVAGFTGAGGQDLDTNDDGALDVLPWSAILDDVALIEDPTGGNSVYSTNTVGPQQFGQPEHAYICVGGLGGQNEWRIGPFAGCPNGFDTPGAVNDCPACFEILDLVCESDCVTGNISLGWINDDVYTEIQVIRDSQPIATLAGTDTSYIDPGVATGIYEYELIGVCGAGNETSTFCTVIHGVYTNQDNVIFAGEGSNGDIDSVGALETALLANGESVVIIDELEGYDCFGQFGANTILWVMNGTFPAKYQMTVADGQALVDVLSAGTSIYIEGAGTFDFDPATPFLDYDGVDNSISDPGVPGAADGSLTTMDGSDFENLDVSGFQDILYVEDRPGASDFNGQLIPTGTVAPLDIPGGVAGLVWVNNPDALPDPAVTETAYGVAVYYKTPAAFGDVISASFEFGGLSADQAQIAGLYATALRRPDTPQGGFDRGDTNVDGLKNIADAVFTLSVLFPAPGTNPTHSCNDAADTNDDGLLNIADAVQTLSVLFPPPGTMPMFPAPNGACGPDPTDDALDCALYDVCP